MMGTRRRYTAEFKAEAVRLVATSGRPVAQIARELGINEQTLHKWKRQVRRTPDSFGATGSNGEERDILKKATAPPNGGANASR